MTAWWWYCGDICECLQARIKSEDGTYSWKGEFHSGPDMIERKEMAEELQEEICTLQSQGHTVEMSEWNKETLEDALTYEFQ